MKFKDLKVGDKFRFASELDEQFRFSGMAQGPWEKLSARTYAHILRPAKPRYTHKVGTINAEVVLESKE